MQAEAPQALKTKKGTVKLFLLGIGMSVAAYVWLCVSISGGESPFQYAPTGAWYDAGTNLNFWLYHAFSGVAHGVLGAGFAMYLFERRVRKIKRQRAAYSTQRMRRR